jgi:hypothetical protein
MPDDYFGNEEQLLFKIVYLLEKSENSNLKDESKELYINIKNKFIRLFKNINTLESTGQIGGNLFTDAVSSVTSFLKTGLLRTSFNEKLKEVITESADLPSDNDNIVADFLKCFTIKMPNDKIDDNNNGDKIRTYYCTINDFVETSDLNVDAAINYTLRYEEVRKFIEKYKNIEEYKVLTNILTLISFNSNIEINRLKYSYNIYFQYSKLTGTNLYSKIHNTLKKLIIDYRKERNNLLNEKYFDLQIIKDNTNKNIVKQEIFLKEASLEELNKNIDIINQAFMKCASKALFYIQEHIFLFFKENKNLDSIDYSLLQISSPLLNKDTPEYSTNYEDNLEDRREEPKSELEPEDAEPEESEEPEEPEEPDEPESEKPEQSESEEQLEAEEQKPELQEPKPELQEPKPELQEPKPGETVEKSEENPEEPEPEPVSPESKPTTLEELEEETNEKDSSSVGGKRSKNNKNNKNKFYKKTKKRKRKKYSRKIY